MGVGHICRSPTFGGRYTRRGTTYVPVCLPACPACTATLNRNLTTTRGKAPAERSQNFWVAPQREKAPHRDFQRNPTPRGTREHSHTCWVAPQGDKAPQHYSLSRLGPPVEKISQTRISLGDTTKSKDVEAQVGKPDFGPKSGRGIHVWARLFSRPAPGP